MKHIYLPALSCLFKFVRKINFSFTIRGKYWLTSTIAALNKTKSYQRDPSWPDVGCVHSGTWCSLVKLHQLQQREHLCPRVWHSSFLLKLVNFYTGIMYRHLTYHFLEPFKLLFISENLSFMQEIFWSSYSWLYLLNWANQ